MLILHMRTWMWTPRTGGVDKSETNSTQNEKSDAFREQSRSALMRAVSVRILSDIVRQGADAIDVTPSDKRRRNVLQNSLFALFVVVLTKLACIFPGITQSPGLGEGPMLLGNDQPGVDQFQPLIIPSICPAFQRVIGKSINYGMLHFKSYSKPQPGHRRPPSRPQNYWIISSRCIVRRCTSSRYHYSN